MITAGEDRGLLAVVVAIAAVGLGAGLAGIPDHVAVAALIAAGLGWLAVAALRRERRIRARLADPRTQPAPRPPAEVSHTRAGPGDHAPAPPAPTTAPTADRSPVAAAGRPHTPTGGAA